MKRWARGAIVVGAGFVLGCAAAEQNGSTTGDGGGLTGQDGGFASGDAGAPGGGDALARVPGSLTTTVRDFSTSHPDMEMMFPDEDGDDDGPELPTTGLVEATLGDDGKPVFRSSVGDENNGAGIVLITSAETFGQWYNTEDGINRELSKTIELEEVSPGIYQYDDAAYFPLSNQEGFGAEGNPHNYHFTTEIHTSFQYLGGEVFTFAGDDDLWMFVDDQLVIDLGGLHLAAEGTVELDDLSLEQGSYHDIHIFHAERKTVDSHFKITTSIAFQVD